LLLAFGSSPPGARLSFVAEPFVDPEASPELTTDFDDPDGLLGSVSLLNRRVNRWMNWQSSMKQKFVLQQLRREVMNVLFDKSSAIGLVSRWLPRVAREGGLPEISHPLTSSSMSDIFPHERARQKGDTLGWPWAMGGLLVWGPGCLVTWMFFPFLDVFFEFRCFILKQ